MPVHDTGSTESTVVGLLCSLCKLHNAKQQNAAECRLQKICCFHRRGCTTTSYGHKQAEELEAARLASQQNGGIRQAFSARVALKRKALIGALHPMYWLAKLEVAPTTKFNSLKDLTIQVGCEHLYELSPGRNAQYSSEQIISELLSLAVDEQILFHG